MFLKGRQYVGVEVTECLNNQIHANICYLEKSKGDILLQGFKVFSGAITDLPQSAENAKISLIFNTKSVLSRTISNGKNLTKSELFQRIFPTENIENFYIQIVEGLEMSIHISVVKKSEIDNLIDLLNQRFFYFDYVFIGPNNLEPILPFVEQNSIRTTNCLHYIKDELIQTFEQSKVEKEIELFNKIVLSNQTLSLVGALYALFPNLKMIPINYEGMSVGKSEIQYKNWISKFMPYIGLGLLGILLINVLLFLRQQERFEQLSVEHQQYERKTELLELYQNQVRDQTEILEKNPWLINSKASFFCDQLMVIKPTTISIEEAIFFPLKKRDELNFAKDVILVKGEVSNSLKLNEWIKKIKSFDWVKKIEVTRLQENKETKNNFEIKIKVNQ